MPERAVEAPRPRPSAGGRIVFVRGMIDTEWVPAVNPLPRPKPIAGSRALSRPMMLPAPPRLALPHVELPRVSIPHIAFPRDLPRVTWRPRVIPRRWVKAATVFAVVAAFLLMLQASVQNFQAEGASMVPGLNDGDHVIVNKLAYSRMDLGAAGWLPFMDSSDLPYLISGPERGDVIVFHLPQHPSKLIKRIIGASGDKVEIRSGHVILNSIVLDEPYAQGPTNCLDSCGPWIIPEGSYFVLGDNRGDSLDSRAGWLVTSGEITGKVLFSY